MPEESKVEVDSRADSFLERPRINVALVKANMIVGNIFDISKVQADKLQVPEWNQNFEYGEIRSGHTLWGTLSKFHECGQNREIVEGNHEATKDLELISSVRKRIPVT